MGCSAFGGIKNRASSFDDAGDVDWRGIAPKQPSSTQYVGVSQGAIPKNMTSNRAIHTVTPTATAVLHAIRTSRLSPRSDVLSVMRSRTPSGGQATQ